VACGYWTPNGSSDLKATAELELLRGDKYAAKALGIANLSHHPAGNPFRKPKLRAEHDLL
jgi:hypothetical protein